MRRWIGRKEWSSGIAWHIASIKDECQLVVSLLAKINQSSQVSLPSIDCLSVHYFLSPLIIATWERI